MPLALPITDQELLRRLAMDDAEFEAYLSDLLASLPAQELTPVALARALAYPWARPTGSFLIDSGEVTPLDELPEHGRSSLRERFATDPARHPLLAIGANGSPEALELKFAHFTGLEDRTVLVLTGRLQDFDVGAVAHPPILGPIPATLFPSPGTAVRTALLWVTAAQFTQLAWSEISYRLGTLRTRFEVDGADARYEEVLVFVSRFGSFRIGNGPVALAAIPAERRTAASMEQEAVLDAAAALILGDGADAEALVRAALADPAAVRESALGTVRRQAVPFVSDRWTPYRGEDLGEEAHANASR